MTNTTAQTLDLSRLEAPKLVETDPDTLVRQFLDEFVRLWQEARLQDPSLPAYDVDMLRTDPAVILTKEFAYGDVHIRQAINDTANALRLATATGSDLDHIAQTYHNTARLLWEPGSATYESDAAYRARAQLSLEAYPLFGLTPGGYIWRVRNLYGDRVQDVKAIKRDGGRIDLVILARSKSPEDISSLIYEIQACFLGDEASQLTDIVTVIPAKPVEVEIQVTLGLPRGPSIPPIIKAATEAIQALAQERYAIGETLHAQAIGAVAKVGPVRFVRVGSPSIDIYGGSDSVPLVTDILIDTQTDYAEI